jgi:hypothetical protein
MSTTKSTIRVELGKLIENGIDILNREVNVKQGKQTDNDPSYYISIDYQKWYTTALAVVSKLAPDRLKDFQEYYKLNNRKETDYLTYTISDYLIGLRTTYQGQPKIGDALALQAFSTKLQNQIGILLSIVVRLDSVLADITGVLQADLFDSELEAAEELLKNGYLRPAGVVAGVTLEGHLATVCDNHGIKITKKNPTIGDYNDALKDVVLDVPQWRFIQRLGDLRNKCAHKQPDEPTKEDAKDLIEGVKKIIKTVF